MNRLALAACTVLCTLSACAAGTPFSGIAGVAVKVSDAARSQRFYREILGFAPLPGEAGYQVNEHQRIVIVPGRSGASDHRLASFSLTTANSRKACELLKRRGIEVSEVSGSQCSLQDPDGNRIVVTRRAKAKPEADARPLSTHLRHAGIHVADLEAAAKFYHEKLGLEIERLQHGKTRWINMRLPGGDYIQMQTAPQNASAERRWSFEHFGLDVVNAHTAYEELLRRGVPPTPRFEPVVGYAGHLKINFADPDNTLVELMELGAAGANERRER